MPDYHYRAVNMNGRIQNGILTAPTTRDLQLRLLQAGMTLIESRQQKDITWQMRLHRGSLRDLAQFCQHMAQLERSSIRLTDSLRDVSANMPPSRLRAKLSEVTQEIEAGSSLSQALSKRQDQFPLPMPALVAAGEASGQLADSFAQLAEHYDWQAKIRSKLIRVLAYPLFALMAMIAVVLFLLTFVIPETSVFLKDMNVTLPIHSRILMNIAAFVHAYGLTIAASLIILTVGVVMTYKRSTTIATNIDRFITRMPLIGAFSIKVDLARFTKILAMLLTTGIDLPPALTTASMAIKNRALKESLDIIREQTNNGNALSFSIQISGIFPSLVSRMILAGEENGQLTTAFQNVARYYEDDVHNTAELFVNAIGPVITLISGSLLIWLILAVFMPIYDILPQLM